MRLPSWIKTDPLKGAHEVKKLLRRHALSTVCEEARCPNQGRCFSKGAATFLILGDKCTRNCSFCAVESSTPLPLDIDEPERVAQAALELKLSFVVVTSVTRDDLPDGGASVFVAAIKALKKTVPHIKVEVLIPDFQANLDAIRKVAEAGPDVFNHNIETIPRLYPAVRPQANYQRSLNVLKSAKNFKPLLTTKSGLMVGLGERFEEVTAVMQDLKAVGCDILTVGQYLRPRKTNIPVSEYINPETFKRYEEEALKIGFKSVASSALVRSSMDAEKISHV
jgi:lipoic acid synthetase